MVTSLRLRSSADIVKRSKNQSKNQKSRTPCNRHSAQSFRFYVFDMFRCDSPYRGSVGTIIQSSPLIRPPLFYNGESVFANLANWSRRPVARMNRTVFGINSSSPSLPQVRLLAPHAAGRRSAGLVPRVPAAKEQWQRAESGTALKLCPRRRGMLSLAASHPPRKSEK